VKNLTLLLLRRRNYEKQHLAMGKGDGHWCGLRHASEHWGGAGGGIQPLYRL
jgi:hypothetical protein